MAMENFILSLSNWPIQPCLTNIAVSPTTSRVFEQVNIQKEQLIPLTFTQFVSRYDLTNSNKDMEEQYANQLQRRRKKVHILKQIWRKMKERRSKSAKLSLSAKSKLLKTKNTSSAKSIWASIAHQKGKAKESPIFYQAKSPTKYSTYFDYYSTSKQINAGKKVSYEEESTRSRRDKTMSKSKGKIGEHGQKSKNNKTVRNIEKDDLLALMTIMLQKWSELDNKHAEELGNTDDLQPHERKRLGKIHHIERQKLKMQIQKIKSKMENQRRVTEMF